MKQVEVRLAFHDWYREGESIYNTNDGLELSLGDYHSGTIFHGSLMLDEENLEDLREALKRDALPVFAVFEASVSPAPVRDAAESEPLNVWDQCDALRARVAGLEGELKALRESNLRLAGEVGTECGNLKNALDELTDARALLADARETIGWIMSSREGAALFGIDVDRALKAEAEIAAGNTVSWEELRLELTAKARALAQPRAERETTDG